MKRTLTATYLLFVFVLGFASCEKDEFVSEYAQRVPAPVNPFLQPGDSLQSIDSRTVPVIAHRGCWSGDSLPQNSLASFRKALGLNIYGTEFDVRQTKDDKLVINHDATFHGLSIASNTYSYLCQYTLPNGETIPLLEDFIKAYLATDTNVLMIVELNLAKLMMLSTCWSIINSFPMFFSSPFQKSIAISLCKKDMAPSPVIWGETWLQ